MIRVQSDRARLYLEGANLPKEVSLYANGEGAQSAAPILNSSNWKHSTVKKNTHYTVGWKLRWSKIGSKWMFNIQYKRIQAAALQCKAGVYLQMVQSPCSHV